MLSKGGRGSEKGERAGLVIEFGCFCVSCCGRGSCGGAEGKVVPKKG